MIFIADIEVTRKQLSETVRKTYVFKKSSRSNIHGGICKDFLKDR